MAVSMWVGALLAGFAILLFAALAWPVRVAFDADERGFAGGGDWLGWGVRFDRRRRVWELRFLGLRLVRRPMTADGSRREEQEGESEAKTVTKKRGYPLSAISTIRLARMAPRELRRLARRVHVDRLELRGVIATPDPALTGELYGYAWGAASAARAWWPAARVELDVDFTTELPRGSVAAGLRARPIWIALGALRIGWAYLRERRRSRRSR